jgi:hypothetical protein
LRYDDEIEKKLKNLFAIKLCQQNFNLKIDHLSIRVFNHSTFFKLFISSMDSPLEIFRRTVFGPHNKTPWAIRLRDTLHFIKQYPQYQLIIGLIPVDQNSFFINSTVLAKFFGLKNRNSCNRDFKQHGFIIDHNCNIINEFKIYAPQIIPSPRCWVKRKFIFDSFNGDSSIEETNLASNYARQVRKSISQTVSHISETIIDIHSQINQSINNSFVNNPFHQSSIGTRAEPGTEIGTGTGTETGTETSEFDSMEGNWIESIDKQFFEWFD